MKALLRFFWPVPAVMAFQIGVFFGTHPHPHGWVVPALWLLLDCALIVVTVLRYRLSREMEELQSELKKALTQMNGERKALETLHPGLVNYGVVVRLKFNFGSEKDAKE